MSSFQRYCTLLTSLFFKVAQRKFSVLDEEKEIHNLSGALKLFFRELKEPLIPYENYEDFIRATGSGKGVLVYCLWECLALAPEGLQEYQCEIYGMPRSALKAWN